MPGIPGAGKLEVPTNETQLMKHEEATPMTIISQAALSGSVDPAALEKLMDLQDRHEKKLAERAFAAAFRAFQRAMPAIAKGRKGDKAKYASYGDIMKVARPVLDQHGFSLSFDQEEDEKTLTIVVVLTHEDGHTRLSRFSLPKDGPLTTKDGRRIQNSAQAQGSTNSYARRYAVSNALDIVLLDEDDDAGALKGATINEEERAEIEDLLDEAGVELPVFLSWLGVSTLAEMPVSMLSAARGNLIKKKAQKGGQDV